jgi:hypothetical protein
LGYWPGRDTPFFLWHLGVGPIHDAGKHTRDGTGAGRRNPKVRGVDEGEPYLTVKQA